MTSPALGPARACLAVAFLAAAGLITAGLVVGAPAPGSAQVLADPASDRSGIAATTTARSPSTTTDVAASRSTRAAKRYGWGKPVARDEFGYTGAPRPKKWSVYDSEGHAGNGVRSPRAWEVRDGYAKVTGKPSGTTGGMSAKFGHQRYGRWEVRMRTNARDPQYHPVLLLWPDSGDWPCGGEIDYAEGTDDPGMVHFFHHYSCDNRQVSAAKSIDTTRWHNYAVEWTPDRIIGYIDGVEWFRDTRHQPPGRMHQTVQLDWFPDGTATRRSWMKLDWVRVYDAAQARTITATTAASAASAGGRIRLAVLGDINHEGNDEERSREGRIANSIAAWNPRAVALLGDFQYQYGDCDSLVSDFDGAGWGALMPKVIGTAGATHDYTSDRSSASNYSRHLEGTCPGQTSGPSLSAREAAHTIRPFRPHWVDLGAWTVISMPAGQWRDDYAEAYGDRWSGPALTDWLRRAVKKANARGDHVLMMTHEPYWSSASDEHDADEGDDQRPWIKVLDRLGVRVILAGHQHNYERFRPQHLNGSRDDADGVQQFQVSTGGIGLRSFASTAPNVAARSDDTYGWLRLVLRPSGAYTWRFVPTEGGFTDSGRRAAP